MSNVLRTDFLVTDKALKKAFAEYIETSEEIYLSTDAVTNDHSIYRSLLQNRKNIKKFFCGIRGYTTVPEVLEDFKGDPDFYVVDDAELFNHNIYMFVRGGETTVICGSSNLTWMAFGANDEFVQLTTFDGRLKIFEIIEAEIRPKLRRVCDEFLDEYRKNFFEACNPK